MIRASVTVIIDMLKDSEVWFFFFSRVDWLSGAYLCYFFYNYHVRNIGGTNLLLFIST